MSLFTTNYHIIECELLQIYKKAFLQTKKILILKYGEKPKINFLSRITLNIIDRNVLPFNHYSMYKNSLLNPFENGKHNRILFNNLLILIYNKTIKDFFIDFLKDNNVYEIYTQNVDINEKFTDLDRDYITLFRLLNWEKINSNENISFEKININWVKKFLQIEKDTINNVIKIKDEHIK